MRHCWDCYGLGVRCEDEPNCYRPGDLCKWAEGICETVPPEEVGTFRCICDSLIVDCSRCDGRGKILTHLEQLAEQGE